MAPTGGRPSVLVVVAAVVVLAAVAYAPVAIAERQWLVVNLCGWLIVMFAPILGKARLRRRQDAERRQDEGQL